MTHIERDNLACIQNLTRRSSAYTMPQSRAIDPRDKDALNEALAAIVLRRIRQGQYTVRMQGCIKELRP